MRITLLYIGKTTFPFVDTGMRMYAERLGHYCRYSAVCIPDLKNASSLSREQIKVREGELILRELKKGGAAPYVVLLDERGARFSSLKWAAHLQKRLNLSGESKEIYFVIGGAYGFSEDVYAAASEKLSLSDMTFSHQIIRLIFIEQLYRAFTIMRGEQYHHE